MKRTMLIGVGVAVVALGGGYAAIGNGGAAAPPAVVEAAAPAAVEAMIVAEARIVPVHSSSLSYASGGIVATILVNEGQQVEAGQVLLELRNAPERARLAAAEAALAQARANYQARAAGATAEEIAAAEAGVAQAEAQVRQAVSTVSQADVAAAQAQVRASQDRLGQLRAGAKDTDLRAATAQVQQAQANLAQQRDTLSAAKTNAELALRQAAEQLKQAQTAFSTATWHWEHVQTHGTDPLQMAIDTQTGAAVPIDLNDAQRHGYYAAYLSAEAALHSAEQAVQQAQTSYETARQNEVSGNQSAEHSAALAQARLDQVRAGASADQLSSAVAQLASAEAQLGSLQGGQYHSQVEAAQAGVAQAQANLARIQAGAPESELTLARAQITSAEAELHLANVLLDETRLHAPFSGTVSLNGLKAGQYVAPGAELIHLADLSQWQIETSDLTELGVVAITPGSAVQISVDALPELRLDGTVRYIKSFGEAKQGDITYTAVVDVPRPDPRLRWNMTATISLPRQ